MAENCPWWTSRMCGVPGLAGICHCDWKGSNYKSCTAFTFNAERERAGHSVEMAMHLLRVSHGHQTKPPKSDTGMPAPVPVSTSSTVQSEDDQIIDLAVRQLRAGKLAEAAQTLQRSGNPAVRAEAKSVSQQAQMIGNAAGNEILGMVLGGSGGSDAYLRRYLETEIFYLEGHRKEVAPLPASVPRSATAERDIIMDTLKKSKDPAIVIPCLEKAGFEFRKEHPTFGLVMGGQQGAVGFLKDPETGRIISARWIPHGGQGEDLIPVDQATVLRSMGFTVVSLDSESLGEVAPARQDRGESGQASLRFGPARQRARPWMPPAAPDGKKKVAAALCAILLGSLGIHKFILGMTTAGVIMLAATLLSCGKAAIVVHIVGIVEGIIYLTKSDAEFYRVYVLEKKAWF